jgi:hypothetical protein
MERLYFGDKLDVLRDHVSDESVDLIYLDPPFNSKRDYNLLFKSPRGLHSSRFGTLPLARQTEVTPPFPSQKNPDEVIRKT